MVTSRPKLQLALDTFDLPAALAPMQRAKDHIDVVEAGTILCYAEGMHAVRALRALYPEKILLADVRIAEAGSIIAKLAFDAGADWVSVVSGATLTTLEVVLKEAQKQRKEVQLELIDGWTWDDAKTWRELGVPWVITHRSRDGEAATRAQGGKLSWTERDFDEMRRLSELGFKVSVAGGVKAEDLPQFKGVPVDLFTVGRAIREADDPAAAAKAFQDAIAQTYGAA